MDYGQRKCLVCGKMFTALKYYSITCGNPDCAVEHRRAIHKASDAKARKRRKEYLAKLIEERDSLLIENLALKKRLGIIGQEALPPEAAKDSAPEAPADSTPAVPEVPKDAAPDAPAAEKAGTVPDNGKSPFVSKQERNCVVCGRPFHPRGNRQRFCSDECLKKSHKKKE